MTATQAKQILWAVAMLLILLAPLALLFGVDLWRIVLVIVFEFAMMTLLSNWIKQ